MLDWDNDRNGVLERLAAAPADLRLVLKTRDDPTFLRSWILHHAAIVGMSGLVIFDNGSTDPAVQAVYDEMDELLVVRFAGYHNDLHRVHKFPELYAALRQDSRYYAVLDTDEFLYWLEPDGSYQHDRRLAEHVLSSAQAVMPGMWLNNVKGYRDRLLTSAPPHPLGTGLHSGKPLVGSALDVSGMINHNFHLPAAALLNGRRANLAVAHLWRLSPAQRCQSNLLKLRQYGVIAGDAGFDAVLLLAPESAGSANARRWIEEIHTLLPLGSYTPDPQARLLPSQMRLVPTAPGEGRLEFASPAEREAFLAFLADPRAAIQRAFAPGLQ